MNEQPQTSLGTKVLRVTVIGILAIFAAAVISSMMTPEPTVDSGTQTLTVTPIDNSVDQPVTKPADTRSSTYYLLKTTYMENCDLDGSMLRFCGCSYDYMYDTLGEDGFINMSVDYGATGIMPSIMLEAVNECI